MHVYIFPSLLLAVIQGLGVALGCLRLSAEIRLPTGGAIVLSKIPSSVR